MSYAATQYRTAKIHTASPLQIVVALYDGAIRFLKEADLAFEKKQVKQRAIALNKAHAIISELQATLDPSKSTELCDELERLYDFVLFQIRTATTTPEKDQLQPSIHVLGTLREAWAELEKREK